MVDCKSMSLVELTEYLESLGEKSFRAKQIYQKDEMTKGIFPCFLRLKKKRCRFQRLMEPENICFHCRMEMSLRVC